MDLNSKRLTQSHMQGGVKMRSPWGQSQATVIPFLAKSVELVPITYSQMPPQSFWHWHQASRRIQRQLSACTTSALLLQAALHLLQRVAVIRSDMNLPPRRHQDGAHLVHIPSHPRTMFWGTFISQLSSPCPTPRKSQPLVTSTITQIQTEIGVQRRPLNLQHIGIQPMLHLPTISLLLQWMILYLKLTTPHVSGHPLLSPKRVCSQTQPCSLLHHQVVLFLLDQSQLFISLL